MMFGDTLQFPPIPASTALFLPPLGKKPELARDMLSMFWDDKADALNYFKELPYRNASTTLGTISFSKNVAPEI